MQQFPQVAIARNLALLLKSYQQEFGLTPSARTRLSVEPGNTSHSWDVPEPPDEVVNDG
jgi:phage terminase small subunit